MPLFFFDEDNDDEEGTPPDVEAEAEASIAEAEAEEPVMLELAADAYEGDSTSSMDDSERDGL